MKSLLLVLLVFFSASFSFGQIPDKLSRAEKIYGLSRFWQEVNYNFVYLSKIDRQAWDGLYLKLLTEVQESKNDYDYYRQLQYFSAFLKDGHTNVLFPKYIRDSIFYTDFGTYQFELSNIEGKAIISRVNKNKENELPVGTEILRVNGILTAEYIEKKIAPYISSSTRHIAEDLSIRYLLEGYNGTTYTLEVRMPDGSIKSICLKIGKTKDADSFPDEVEAMFQFNWIMEGVAYIALNSFSSWDLMNSFSEKLPEIRKAEKLIVDIRKNGGGNEQIGREIIKYLTRDTVLYGSKSQSRLHIPYYKAWGSVVKENEKNQNPNLQQAYLSFQDRYFYDFPHYPYSTENLDITRIEVPTVLLIGHQTGSAAEDFLIYASNQDHMFKIGEPTYGSTGQPFVFDLPGGGIGRVCTKKDMYPDGTEFVGSGILPDIEVRRSLSDYLQNRDPVLEKALEYLESK